MTIKSPRKVRLGWPKTKISCIQAAQIPTETKPKPAILSINSNLSKKQITTEIIASHSKWFSGLVQYFARKIFTVLDFLHKIMISVISLTSMYNQKKRRISSRGIKYGLFRDILSATKFPRIHETIAKVSPTIFTIRIFRERWTFQGSMSVKKWTWTRHMIW